MLTVKERRSTRFEAIESQPAMTNIVSRLDITRMFCEVDDFFQLFECYWQQLPQLPSIAGERSCRSRMSRG
ncbi:MULTISPECIES: hypothetical protein [unclassified Moorena]|uniref:hypothetical protein n=1 Tax=unclassified Moorena TaxID=2683338 RepID=UPI0005C83CBE|nr:MULTISPECIES: hypothetical protein [unclassified Moorena]NEQ17758.1 hypothetical protein [Moorena sp. SIO3E2]NER87312.1 hypothetical protein [Moorena sp. SIO3A2]NES44527.1 hypothetical protein [Moorena sp. SIO2C4]OLT65301.1 hypothetical protein BI334_09845 [Moorena producens 3L]